MDSSGTVKKLFKLIDSLGFLLVMTHKKENIYCLLAVIRNA
jgi:hypothetical protein